MKKFILIFTLIFTFFITNINVNAETLTCDFTTKYEEYFSRFGKDFVIGELDKLYDIYVNEYQENYPFYQIEPEIVYNGHYYLLFRLIVFTENPQTSWYYTEVSGGDDFYKYFAHYNLNPFIYKTISYVINEDDSLTLVTDNFSTGTTEYLYYTNSFKCTISVPFYSSLIPGFIMPTYHDFSLVRLQTEPNSSSYYEFKEHADYYRFEPYSTYLGLSVNEKNYTEVNLDNYEYVILNLKDYNQNAFETNLKVKGMIGITPVYEFGTTEKSVITDRCNISYDDYTNYRFFILENDLINNAVYVVKKCKDNSSFKFDSTLFNITYVTADNVDDPVITVGGKDYHTIPFKDLSNTANKNEEENFVPGASEQFSPLENVTKYITSFWDSLTTFMSLVTKFFNTLPIEIRAIAITTFATGCTLGLIKIIKS